jgi:hypothetical protein
VSTVVPRTYLKEDSNGRTLSMVRCPFCDKEMQTKREPEFRSHLRTECEEAPREIDYGR